MDGTRRIQDNAVFDLRPVGQSSIPIHNFRDHIVEWHIQWKLSDWRGLCLFHQVDRSIRENSDIERGCDTGEVGIFYILSS